MNELFKNKTKCTQKEYEAFLKSYEKEYAFSEWTYTILYIGFFILCIVLGILNKEILLTIALIIGLIIYIWYKFIRPVTKIKNQNKKLEKEYTNTYNFYKRYFSVENVDGSAQILYFKVYKVIENKTHFYIYISREYAFIVDKNGFEKGDCNEFKKFIRKKVFGKYKVEN